MSTTIILLIALVVVIVIILLVITRMGVREPAIKGTEADNIAQRLAAQRRAQEIQMPKVSASAYKADITEDVRIVLKLLETLGYRYLVDVKLPDNTIKAGWEIHSTQSSSYDEDLRHERTTTGTTYLLSDGRIGFQRDSGIIYKTMSPKEVSKLDEQSYNNILQGINNLRQRLRADLKKQ